MERLRRAWLPVLLVLVVIGLVVFAPDGNTVDREPQAMTGTWEGNDIELRYHGEISSNALFGRGQRLTDQVRPKDAQGNPEGVFHEADTHWLQLELRVNDDVRHLLLARQPVMNNVSWDAIARAGAAMGDDSQVRVDGEPFAQDAVVTAADGQRYRVRLLRCGQSTMAHLSEWNLLVGGVHEGDLDFQGERYGWLQPPYTDEELKVGYDGSLNWCQDPWRATRNERVVRGYFNVSRLHATHTSFAGDRIYWRPVLERIDEDDPPPPFDATPQVSPNRAVAYYGMVSYAEVFGEEPGVVDLVTIREGRIIDDGRPNWLRFQVEGATLLVAAKPVGHSVSWDALARAGVVLGEGMLRVGRSAYPQDIEVSDVEGHRYRVRLLRCGRSTLDHRSEWNALIGGVHQGDGDFLPNPDGTYGWVRRPLTDRLLHIGTAQGTASWCQETEQRPGGLYATNRGYLTVARYHTTRTRFGGYGFSWRPVLERIEEP